MYYIINEIAKMDNLPHQITHSSDIYRKKETNNIIVGDIDVFYKDRM